MNEIQIFKNENFGEIRVAEVNRKPIHKILNKAI